MEDSNNQIVTTDTSTVTLTAVTKPAGATITGPLTAVVHNGVATFSNLVLSKVGGYTFAVTDGLLTGATSSTLTVVVPPTHLVFFQQPTTALTAGQTLPSIVVEVMDASGHVVQADNSPITLTIPSGASASGTLTANAIAGQATFSGIILDGAGKFTISASQTGLPAANSKAITVNPGSASQLIMTTPSIATTVGKPLAPAIVLKVEDQFGNVVTTDKSKVTLAITGHPVNGTLSGLTIASVSKGVATFKTLTPTLAGDYTLQFTDSAIGVQAAALYRPCHPWHRHAGGAQSRRGVYLWPGDHTDHFGEVQHAKFHSFRGECHPDGQRQ